MIEDKDYFMRLVHETVRMLMRLIFQKDIDAQSDLSVPAELMEIYEELTAMIDNGQINEAENLLLERLDPENRAYFQMALMFYERLGCKSEQFLEEHDYTQEEVMDGLKYLVDSCGYGVLWDTASK